MLFLKAFLVGGLICMAAQLVLDNTKLSPGHVLSGLTVGGGILGGLGIYDRLVAFAGAGATVPISSFGNSLVKGALQEVNQNGLMGVLTGMFEITSTGIAAAIVFAFLTAVTFNPKS